MYQNTATKIKDIKGWRGAASLYKCEPPLDGHEYVIASAANVPFSGPETYLFPATAEGEAENMTELSGSMKGTLSHAEAFEDAGYTVVG